MMHEINFYGIVQAFKAQSNPFAQHVFYRAPLTRVCLLFAERRSWHGAQQRCRQIYNGPFPLPRPFLTCDLHSFYRTRPSRMPSTAWYAAAPRPMPSLDRFCMSRLADVCRLACSQRRYGVSPNLLCVPPQLLLYMSLAPGKQCLKTASGEPGVSCTVSPFVFCLQRRSSCTRRAVPTRRQPSRLATMALRPARTAAWALSPRIRCAASLPRCLSRGPFFG
jgi:hypothetical protein